MKNFLKVILLLGIAGGVYFYAFYKTPQQRHFEQVLAAAQSGDANASFEVAGLYASGNGLAAPNGKEAAEWYRKAASAGNTEAAWQLAQLFTQGTLVPADLEEASAYLLVAARGGNVAAQKELARFYAEGLGGLEKNDAEALFWQLEAAQNGDSDAAALLPQMEQANPDMYQAVANFRTLLEQARQGDASAQVQVGQALHTAQPVARNDEEAFQWFSRAWQEGQLPQAAYELSQLYQNGEGVEKDENKAMELLSAAAQAKNPDAQYVFGTMAYGANPPKYEDAFAWFSNAAASGHAQGQYMTGFMLLQGQGTNKSVPMALSFFRKSAEQNYPAAQYVLGQIYWKGLGVPVNKKEGGQWLRRAADNGNTAAQALLDAK